MTRATRGPTTGASTSRGFPTRAIWEGFRRRRKARALRATPALGHALLRHDRRPPAPDRGLPPAHGRRPAWGGRALRVPRPHGAPARRALRARRRPQGRHSRHLAERRGPRPAGGRPHQHGRPGALHGDRLPAHPAGGVRRRGLPRAHALRARDDGRRRALALPLRARPLRHGQHARRGRARRGPGGDGGGLPCHQPLQTPTRQTSARTPTRASSTPQ